MKILVLILVIGSIAGCSRHKHTVELSGADKYPISACEQCKNMKPFYKNGQWLEDR